MTLRLSEGLGLPLGCMRRPSSARTRKEDVTISRYMREKLIAVVVEERSRRSVVSLDGLPPFSLYKLVLGVHSGTKLLLGRANEGKTRQHVQLLIRVALGVNVTSSRSSYPIKNNSDGIRKRLNFPV